MTWFPAFSLYSWNYRRGPHDADAYLSHMGLWDLVPDGSGELRRTPTTLGPQYAALIAESNERQGAR